MILRLWLWIRLKVGRLFAPRKATLFSSDLWVQKPVPTPLGEGSIVVSKLAIQTWTCEKGHEFRGFHPFTVTYHPTTEAQSQESNNSGPLCPQCYIVFHDANFSMRLKMPVPPGAGGA